MQERYRFTPPDGIFFATFTIVDWVDIFTRRKYAEAMENYLNFAIENKGLVVYSYCIMPNHIHLLFTTKYHNPSDVIKSLKGYSGLNILRLIASNKRESRRTWMMELFKLKKKSRTNKSERQLWVKRNHPLRVNHIDSFNRVTKYIHYNPVHAGLVTEAGYYRYSSANPNCEVQVTQFV